MKSRQKPISVMLLAYFLCSILTSHGQTMTIQADAEGRKITKKEIEAFVTTVGDIMQENYIIEEKGLEVQKVLKNNLKKKKYKTVREAGALVDILRNDVQAIINDSHFNLYFFPRSKDMNWVSSDAPEEEHRKEEEEFARKASKINYGLTHVEILDGNVGYLKVSSFNAPLEAAKTAVSSAINFLSNADALIIDVRQNGGGQPEYVNWLESFFFEEDGMLISTYRNRSKNTLTKFRVMTEEELGDKKLTKKPLYVLTSGATGSGGEAFPYDLQSFGKATVVGERTLGGGHGFSPVMIEFEGIGYMAIAVPDLSLDNAKTGTNWEGVGVIPDVKVPAPKALSEAHILALTDLSAQAKDPEAASLYDGIIEQIRFLSENDLQSSSEMDLEEYTGTFGPRTITVENNQLMYQRLPGPKIPLVMIGVDMFKLDIELTPTPKVKFKREEEKIIGFDLIRGPESTDFQRKD